MAQPNIQTLGELKKTGYQALAIHEELRKNLIARIQSKQRVFEGIYGYDETVIPELERAILAGHNILLLGLRGQAKTRIARLLVHLLDEYVPVIKGSPLNEDPLHPISFFGKDLIRIKGDETPIEWWHRSERYTEKLATPDVSVADLIGDLDPIKAANEKLDYSDERVIHFGLIPRSHRGIFVINELPDLQPRIQVALFNILQEEDIQIRGFKLRLPLDLQFVFTENPEDYTNRGSIVTPLKDRIESQILTHYPKSLEISLQITSQESRINEQQRASIQVSELLKELVEQVAIEARSSEYVDKKSGVSARLTISAMENLIASAERRLLLNGENQTNARISDLYSIIPAITGKIELVYEGEQEGSFLVAQTLIRKAIRSVFLRYFPDPASFKGKQKDKSPYTATIAWFSEGHELDLLNEANEETYIAQLQSVAGTEKCLAAFKGTQAMNTALMTEFVLHGLAECSLIGKDVLAGVTSFQDLFNSVFDSGNFEENGEE